MFNALTLSLSAIPIAPHSVFGTTPSPTNPEYPQKSVLSPFFCQDSYGQHTFFSSQVSLCRFLVGVEHLSASLYLMTVQLWGRRLAIFVLSKRETLVVEWIRAKKEGGGVCGKGVTVAHYDISVQKSEWVRVVPFTRCVLSNHKMWLLQGRHAVGQSCVIYQPNN